MLRLIVVVLITVGFVFGCGNADENNYNNQANIASDADLELTKEIDVNDKPAECAGYISPPEVDMGAIVPGDKAYAGFVIGNNGGESFEINSIELEVKEGKPEWASIELLNEEQLTVEPDQEIPLRVWFMPPTGERMQATLVVKTDCPSTPILTALVYSTPKGISVLDVPNELDFGSVLYIASTDYVHFAEQDLIITNAAPSDSTQPLTITNISLQENSPDLVLHILCSLPIIIPAGDTVHCGLKVHKSTEGVGEYNLYIVSNATSGEQNKVVKLKIDGALPEANVSTQQLLFEPTVIGQTSTQLFNISCESSVPCYLEKIKFVKSAVFHQSAESTCMPDEIIANQCQVAIEFTPNKKGKFTDGVLIKILGLEPIHIWLFGEGTGDSTEKNIAR